jgi:hypothetical protein
MKLSLYLSIFCRKMFIYLYYLLLHRNSEWLFILTGLKRTREGGRRVLPAHVDRHVSKSQTYFARCRGVRFTGHK